jgi:hypothetical protein
VTNFSVLLPTLVKANIRFILVGGAAAIAHGSSRLTNDLDVVYDRDFQNFEQIVRALEPYQPYLRGAAPGLPFRWDVKTLKAGLNFTLTTSLGYLDLLGEIVGGGKYEDLLPHSIRLALFDVSCLCLNLEKLIQVKRATGRPKDLETVAELELIAQEKSGK